MGKHTYRPSGAHMIVIKSGRHPFEVVLLAVFVVVGATNIFNYNLAASSVIRDLPDPFGRIYYSGLMVGGAVALFGVFWRGLSGPLIERSGLVILTGLWAAFGGLLFAFGWRGVQFALLFIGFAAGAVWRSVQIGRELKAVVAASAVTGGTEHVEDG